MEIPAKGGGQPPEHVLHNPNDEHPEHVLSSPNVAAVSPDQQHSSTTHAVAPATHSSNTTITSSVVNGIGQWKSWCRSFATPLLAMLDLVDNALDAAVGGGVEVPGHGHDNDDDSSISSISSSSNNPGNSTHKTSSRIVISYDKPYSAHYNQSNNETTGLVMTNNSVEPIKSMHEILRVYNSGKANDSGQNIGQNGVGLKQGCATLSPCSFCLVKTVTTTTTQEGAQITTTCYSLGILAGSLQTEQLCFLPVLQHDLSGRSAQRQTVLLRWARQNTGISKCIRDYGSGSLLLGVQRLDKHMTQMTEGKWKHYNHVFRLVLFGMHHQTNISSSLSFSEEEEQQEEEEDLQHDRVKGLLDQLIEDLPRRYLHVPDHVSVIICRQRIRFGYWQWRMADMARFDLKIKKTVAIANDPNWNTFSCQQDHNHGVDNEIDCYSIRIFVGFDFSRLTQEDSSNDLAMYVYSRRPGRLIKTIPSARHQLALASGSSEYNQAMTILIDDYQGKLPLNPTKQDLAFSEEANGEIHHQNLVAWTRFAAKVYYRYYKDSKFSKSKELITEALKWVANNQVQQQQAQEDNSGNAAFSFPQLHECQFNRFKGELVKGSIRNGKIQLAALKLQELVVGEHSQVFRMPNEGILLEDHRIAQLVAKKRKREKESPTLLREKDGEISYLTGRIDELEAQLQEAKPMSETEQTVAMADKIDELEGALQDYKSREKEWEKEKSLLKTDCEAMKKEIKHLKFTMKEKDRNLERFRNYYYGDTKDEDSHRGDV